MKRRYQKSTIKSCYWEIQLIENENGFTLTKTHLRRDDGEQIETSSRELTKKQAEEFKVKNKGFLIEIY